jgi:PAS domain S-box-containing protein
MDELQLKNIVQYNLNGVLSSEDSVKKALNAMSTFAISSIVIVDKANHPIGIFTEYDALKIIANNGTITTSLSEVMSIELLAILETVYLHDAYILLTDIGYRHLIVVNEKKEYRGIVSEGDFLRFMSLEHLSKLEIVEQVMDKAPVVIEPTFTLQKVAQLMSERHSDYAIVVKNFKPIGIVDERTIAHHFIHAPQSYTMIVDELISDEIHFISKSISLQEAAILITKHGVHQLIVIDEQERVVGLLKRFDVLKAIHGSYFEFLIKTIEKKSKVLEKLLVSQKLLLEKSNLLDTVINTIPDLIWVKDVEGKYLTCNHMFERFYNTSRLEIVGKDDYDFVSTELADFFRINDQNAIKNNKPVQNEEYLIFNDGSYEGTFETLKTPVKDSDGKILGVLGIARDISERKIREQELQQRDNELRSAQELAHVGSWIWDFKSDKLRGSEETHKIFGIESLESVTFSEMLDVIHPEDREMVNANVEIANQTGIYNLVHRIIVDGEIKWISSSAKYIRDESGEYVEARGMLQDITTQKLYELELERLANYDLLTGLANRTYLLAHLQKLIYRNKRSKNNAAF